MRSCDNQSDRLICTIIGYVTKQVSCFDPAPAGQLQPGYAEHQQQLKCGGATREQQQQQPQQQAHLAAEQLPETQLSQDLDRLTLDQQAQQQDPDQIYHDWGDKQLQNALGSLPGANR